MYDYYIFDRFEIYQKLSLFIEIVYNYNILINKNSNLKRLSVDHKILSDIKWNLMSLYLNIKRKRLKQKITYFYETKWFERLQSVLKPVTIVTTF